MQTAYNKQNLQPTVIKYGLISAAVSIVSSLLMYLMKFYGSWYSFLMLAVGIAILFFAIKEHRDKQGGYITFGDAFLVAFLSSLLGGVIGVLWVYIQQHFITPDMVAEQAEIAVENMSAWISDEAALEQMRESILHPPAYTPLISLLMIAGINAIIAGIMALIMKKEPSAF